MTKKIIPDIIQEQDIAFMTGEHSVREAGRYMVENNVGSVLILDDGKLQGIFTERDALNIFVATRRNPDHTNLSDIMTPNPQTIAADASPAAALEMMIAGRFRHLPVVDGDGKVLGVLSQRDLVGHT